LYRPLPLHAHALPGVLTTLGRAGDRLGALCPPGRTFSPESSCRESRASPEPPQRDNQIATAPWNWRASPLRGFPELQRWRLENRYGPIRSVEGSNPSPSAPRAQTADFRRERVPACGSRRPRGRPQETSGGPARHAGALERDLCGRRRRRHGREGDRARRKVIVPPFDAPWVRMAVIGDPQGATFIASKFVPEKKDLGSRTDAAVGAG
jgi:hypothetical protein